MTSYGDHRKAEDTARPGPPAPAPRPPGANMMESVERSTEEIARRVAWLKAYKEQVARDRAAAQA